MGSPVSSVVAHIFMECLEERALRNTVQWQPRLWKRYVDDVFSVALKRMVDALLKHLNGMDAKIRFTMEQEKNGYISFFDVGVRRQSMGQLEQVFFEKGRIQTKLWLLIRIMPRQPRKQLSER